MDADATSHRLISPAIAGLAGAMLLPSLGTSVANVALPALADAFEASFAEVQWVLLSYLIASTALLLGAGRLGDRAGRKRVLLAGVVLFTVASALCAAASTIDLLIAARAAQGIGAAAMMALSMALVRDSVPEARVGSAMGLLGATSAVGTALGPALGGLLLAAFGWSAVFLVNLPLGLVAAALVWRSLPADEAGGRRVAEPFISVPLLREGGLGFSLSLSALISAVMMATLVTGPFYLAGALGLSAAGIGLAMAVGPAVAALAGVPAGRLVDRCGSGSATVAGLVALLGGCALLALAPAALGVAGFVAPVALATAGYALFQAANNSAVMAGAAAGRRGTVAGVLALSRNVGLIAGASAAGALFAFASGGGTSEAPGAVERGLHATFTVAAFVVAAALLLALRRRKHALPP